VDAIRALAMDAVQKANSGHPGTPMALAPVAYTIFTRFLRHNPENPVWPDRDRFVLSAGHASMLLYSMLHLTGYDLTMEDLKNFRQWGSRTPGHPEHSHTPGVETTTGPLGQGFANGVGMTIAERFLAGRYNRIGHEIMDHRVYAICSDGDLMEGVTSESASIAGQLGLGKLIYVYDDNRITIDGPTAVSFDTEDKAKRFEAYGWHVQRVEDAEDLEALEEALSNARDEEERPSLVIVRSHIAYPAPRGGVRAHGLPPRRPRARGRVAGTLFGLARRVPGARGGVVSGLEWRAGARLRGGTPRLRPCGDGEARHSQGGGTGYGRPQRLRPDDDRRGGRSRAVDEHRVQGWRPLLRDPHRT
jgi:transketolase